MMRRNQHINNASAYTTETRRCCVAFHEAGHAGAIYLVNRAREIPPQAFSLTFNIVEAGNPSSYQDYIARIDDGRLLHALPAALSDWRHLPRETGHDWIQTQDDLLNAFEADIINLLAGPLAEAKFIAEIDGEIFLRRLVDPPALENYGGSFDLELIDAYLRCYSDAAWERERKLNQLHEMAFEFINDYYNWRAVSKLANYILGANMNTLCHEEVAAILDDAF